MFLCLTTPNICPNQVCCKEMVKNFAVWWNISNPLHVYKNDQSLHYIGIQSNVHGYPNESQNASLLVKIPWKIDLFTIENFWESQLQ